MKVLVTGGGGYIGSVLVGRLLETGFDTRVVDALIFGGEGLVPWWRHRYFEFMRGDIRDDHFLDAALKDADSVVHLAGIVGEPLCNKYPQVAIEVNEKSTYKLVDKCREQKIERFIFASTCSNYGVQREDELVDEDSALKPVSLYSKTKVAAEKYIMESSDSSFNPIILRFATAFGVSPKMRYDLLLNELVQNAAFNKKLTIYGASHWRPFVHVRDVAEACLLCLIVSNEKIKQRIFNVGSERNNCKKDYLAHLIRKYFPKIEIDIDEGKFDPRSYRVSFKRIEDTLGFKAVRTVEDGVVELKEAISEEILAQSGSKPSDPTFGYSTPMASRLGGNGTYGHTLSRFTGQS